MNKISNKEFAWYLGCGVVVAIGLIITILGIVGTHAPGITSEFFVNKMQAKLNLDFRFFGLIIMALGAIVAIIVLLYNAKRADRDVEKKIRREQRLNAQVSKNLEVKSAVAFVDEETK